VVADGLEVAGEEVGWVRVHGITSELEDFVRSAGG
jgi:hypothetical protein